MAERTTRGLVARAATLAGEVGEVVAGTAAKVREEVRGGRSGTGAAPGTDRWQTVTVLRPADEVVVDGRPPRPLADLGDAVEVRTAPAPRDRGTELSARLRQPAGHGDDRREELRAALRRSKQLLETGEELVVAPVHGWRSPTPQGRLLDRVVRRAGGEGVL